MTPVFQEIYHRERGDCLRATIASLFDLESIQVPHFMLFQGNQWRSVFNAFVYGMGYKWIGPGVPHKDVISETPSVNGFYEACVPSKNFEGAWHSVIINSEGVVVHDPDHIRKWKGVNVLSSRDLRHWTIIEKIQDGSDKKE